MNKQYYAERPQSVELIRSLGISTTVIRFNIEERHPDPDDPQQAPWMADEVEYNHKEALQESDYGPMVSAIIRSEYSEDAVEAIVNNYLADPDGHTEEFQQLQEWRAKAKQAARTIIDDAIEQQQQ